MWWNLWITWWILDQREAKGGQLVAVGTPEQILKSKTSETAKFLKGVFPASTEQIREIWRETFQESGELLSVEETEDKTKKFEFENNCKG